MGQSAFDAAAVDFACFANLLQRTLEWESVGLEPVEESRFAKDSGVWVLRGVDVSICLLSERVSQLRRLYRPMKPGKKN